MKNYLFVFLLLGLSFSACTKTNYEDNLPQLEITVINPLDDFVSNAKVSLFQNENDWNNKANSVSEQSTDANGLVLFEDLEERTYYFLVQKGELNNMESASYIDTPLEINVKAQVITVIL